MQRKNSSFTVAEELALRFEHLIEAGVYKEGDKLPSVREVALAERLNPNTVAHAFQKVCEDGYAVSFEKKGYFVGPKSMKDPLMKLIRSLLKEGYTLDDLQNALDRARKEMGGND